MKHGDLPTRWQERLASFLQNKYGEERAKLWAYDFRVDSSLKINFADGSFVFFNYAFCLVSKELKEIAIFTEHCGYHIFYLADSTIEPINTEVIEID